MQPALSSCTSRASSSGGGEPINVPQTCTSAAGAGATPAADGIPPADWMLQAFGSPSAVAAVLAAVNTATAISLLCQQQHADSQAPWSMNAGKRLAEPMAGAGPPTQPAALQSGIAATRNREDLRASSAHPAAPDEGEALEGCCSGASNTSGASATRRTAKRRLDHTGSRG
jgi:hypothetical protein